MAEIKLDRRPVPGWVLPVVLLVALAALAGHWLWRSIQGAERIGFGVPAGYRNLVVAYEGRAWIPVAVDEVVLFPDDQMVEVGRVDGRSLYASPAHGMGGGGGGVAPPAGLITRPWGRIYLRVGDGRYLPMRWRPTDRKMSLKAKPAAEPS